MLVVVMQLFYEGSGSCLFFRFCSCIKAKAFVEEWYINLRGSLQHPIAWKTPTFTSWRWLQVGLRLFRQQWLKRIMLLQYICKCYFCRNINMSNITFTCSTSIRVIPDRFVVCDVRLRNYTPIRHHILDTQGFPTASTSWHCPIEHSGGMWSLGSSM